MRIRQHKTAQRLRYAFENMVKGRLSKNLNTYREEEAANRDMDGRRSPLYGVTHSLKGVVQQRERPLPFLLRICNIIEGPSNE